MICYKGIRKGESMPIFELMLKGLVDAYGEVKICSADEEYIVKNELDRDLELDDVIGSGSSVSESVRNAWLNLQEQG